MLKLIERGRTARGPVAAADAQHAPARGAGRRSARHDRLDAHRRRAAGRPGRGAGRRTRAGDFFEGVLAHADRRFRACIARLAKGVWRAEEAVDNDCFEPIDGKIAVTLTVKDDGLIVDFAGTSPQLRGFKNSSIANSTSAVFMALVVVLRARPAQERRRLPRRRDPPARGHAW